MPPTELEDHEAEANSQSGEGQESPLQDSNENDSNDSPKKRPVKNKRNYVIFKEERRNDIKA